MLSTVTFSARRATTAGIFIQYPQKCVLLTIIGVNPGSCLHWLSEYVMISMAWLTCAFDLCGPPSSTQLH
jgi:hypothetical protein